MSHLWSRRGVLGALGGAAAVGAAPGFVRPAKAAGLWDKVKAAGLLRIGIADNIPWSKLNPDGTMTGIAPLTVYAVAKRMGIQKVEGIIATYADLIPGLNAGQVHIREGSPFVDRPLGDTRARTRTGASIVAIVRDEEVLASPGPAEPLRAGDVLVVIGTEDGISGVGNIVVDG